MQKFLRTLTLVALLVVPWVMQGQNAQVSEYEGTASTATYSTVVGTTGANAWTSANQSAGYVDISMPFAMYFGENQIASGSTLRVHNDGSAEFTSLAGSRLAPLYLDGGYTTTASSVYTKSSAQQLVVEWRKVVSGTNSYSFQLKLYPTGDVEFCYGPMTINSSINVLVGMMSSATDIFRVGGADGTNDWSDITRYTTGTTPRALSTTDYPVFNTTTNQGMVYTFTQPACVKPTGITATATAWNTVNVEWTVSSTGNSYQVKYSTDPDFDPSTEGQTVTSTSLTANVTGLTGSTTYYFYVRKMCGSTPSGWSSMATATTLPGCYSANMPSVTPDGVVTWTSPDPLVTSYDVIYGSYGFDPATEGTTISNITGLTTTIPNLGSNVRYDVYLRTHCSASNVTTDWVGPVTFTSPCIGGCTYTLILQDTYGDTWNGNVLEYYVGSVLAGTFANNDADANSEGRNPDNDTILLSVCNGDQISFVYNAIGDYASENNTTIINHVGEILVDGYNGGNGTATVYSGVGCYIPTCPKPSALAITDVTGNNVTLSWTENGTATAWQIKYGLFTDENDYTIVDATTNPFTVSGLGLGEWFFFVRSNCAANDQSEWIGGVSQNFGYCTPAPTSHDNNGITNVSFGNTLVVNDNNATTAATRYQNHSDMIGDFFAGTTAEVNITLDAGYSYGTKVWVDWNNDFEFSNDEQVYFELAPSTRPYIVNAVFSIPISVPLGDYRMRIGATDNDAGPDPCYTGTYGVMRDYTIRLVAAPSCFKPNSLAVSGVTSTEATLTWVEAGLSTQWEVKLGAQGFNPDEEGTSYIVNGTPTLALDYLFMVTDYDAYVRAICDPEGPTEWSNKVEFRTLCPNGGEVEVTGTTLATNHMPMNTYYGYSYSQQLITEAEMGGAKTITGISFNYNYSSALTNEQDVQIYMGTTSKSSFASNTDTVDPGTLTLVYSGPLLCSQGWNEFYFTTPFVYNGTGNVVVAVDENSSSYTGSSARFSTYSTADNMSILYYSDSYNPDPTNLLPYSGSKYVYKYRSWMKLISACDTGSCNAPTTVIALSETEYAATLTFTDVNGEANPTYGIVYGPQGFNPASAGTTVSPINTNNYTISNLAAQTSYDVYVYAICSGTNGRMVKYNFVTPFIPNCKTPIIDGTYGASNISYNTATLTWRQPGDVPQTWTVRYAATDFNPATAAATDYTELIVPGSTTPAAQLTGLVAGTTYYVYIKATCATSPVLDESPWLSMSNANPAYTFTTPTCVDPTAVAATQVTNSTAMISWTSNATAWTVKYGTAGFDPDNEGTAVSATTASIELTGLDAYTYYDVYVKANCTATDESDWSAAATFRTSCPDGGDATLGNGTYTSAYVPVHYNWGNTYCQQIFTAQELTEAGMSAGPIQGISFSWYYRSSYTKEFTIYIGTTNKDEFNDNSDWITVTSDPVYGPAEFATSAAQENFAFNTPFVWDGASNIVVTTIMNQYGGSGTGGSGITAYAYDAGYNRSLYNYRDSYAFVVNDPETSGSQHKGISNYRANITFMANCNADVTCFAPASVTTTITPANVVTVNWAPRTDLRPVVNNYELKYGLEGFNPETQGVLVPALNNVNTYIINADLAANTNYDVYVRTVCDAANEDYSNWTKASFTTYPTCWAPVSLTVNSTEQTSATLSWSNNPDAPTAATRWEVCYGPEGFGDPDYRGTKVETTNNTNFVVNGLNHTTKYEFYVRAICSADDKSEWSAVATGTTQCGVWQYADMPLVENFDGFTGTTSSAVASHVLPNCWNYLNGGTSYPGYPIAYNGASYSHSGNNHMRFYEYTTTGYADQYAILPEFGFDLDTVVVGFYARESSTTTTYVGMIVVGVMTDPEDASTFVAVDTILPTTTSYEYFEADMSTYEGNGRYIALKAPKPTTGYNIVYLDDLTVKLREKVNVMPNNGGTVVACNEFVMPDTTGGSYAGNLNATYVVRPAEAGHVAHITGSYDLESGYDYLNVYRGAATTANLIGRYTGTGEIDFKTTSHLWVDSGYVTLVLTTDDDNAFAYTGFKILVSCEQPNASEDTIQDVIEVNGTYTWTAGNGQTYTNHSTMEAAPDLPEDLTFPVVNVAGYDSVYRHLALTVHPTYELNYSHVMCERDEYEFYGNTYTTTGNYTVTLQSVYGADSVGILALQVNPAPTAAISYNGRVVTEIADYCDNAELTILARSNMDNATFLWEDSSAAGSRVVVPHEQGTYTVAATNPTTGCTSLPATVNVTTTPVPVLAINGIDEICFGESTTLTVTDSNNVDATYRWSTGATTTSITVNPTETTTYTVAATTNNTSACVVTAEYTVTVNPLPTIATPVASVSEICRDSVVTLTAESVEGYSYLWNTGAATAVTTVAAASTAAYTVTVTDLNGCVNEFTTTPVTVYPSYELNDTLSVCYTYNPYTWGAQTITENGAYDQVFTIAHGCDSIVHLTFTFEEMGVENSYREVCEGTSITWGEETFDALETATVTFIDNSGECPVQKNLYLTVNHPAATALSQTVCDSYTWPVSGETYTESGEYAVVLATTKGCDSTVTLNLTVNYQNTGVETVTACDSYVWNLNGVAYTETTNEPTFTLQNQWGCDSVVTLDLTVNYRTYYEDFHCVRDAKNYTWLDNETYMLNVAVADGIEHVIGDNALGCDSVFQLHLVLNPVTDTLNWLTIEDACDEYEVANAVVFDDEDDCNGHIEPLYLRESGDYEIRTRAADGHDQWTRLHLTVTPSTYHTTIASECLPYTWSILDADNEPFEIATITADMVDGAAVYNMSIDLREAGFVASTCSQIEVLRLTPKYPTDSVTDVVAICQNGSWTDADNDVFYGSNYKVDSTYIITWNDSDTNDAGCRLNKQVELTINPIYNATMELTLCESMFENGKYILEDEKHDSATVELTIPSALNEVAYTDSVVASWTTALGCDSIVTVVYTVNPTMSVVDKYTVCYREGYEWDANGRNYSEAGVYTDTVVVDNPTTGCTLNRVLDLTVLGVYEKYDTTNVCTSYEGPDGETYRETKTFEVEFEGSFDSTQYCDAVMRRTYVVRQTELIHQYVTSNLPYTWMNGRTYTESIENVYYDAPGEGDCGNVYTLHLTIVDPITFCDDAFPYNTGVNGIVIDSDDYNVSTVSYCLDNPYATSIGTSGGPMYWAIKYEAGQLGDVFNVSGAHLYYDNSYPGNYTASVYVGGSNAPGTMVSSKTVNYTSSDATGWKQIHFDDVVNVDNQSFWLVFNTNGPTFPATSVEYAEVNDQNSTWVSLNGTEWDHSTDYGLYYAWMLKADISTTMWRNNDPNGNDTILYYTVNPTYNDNISDVACDSYTWDGTTYTESGVYTKGYTTVNGCDSTVMLNLTINVSNAETVTEVACDSFTWTDGNDSTYTESGNYVYTTTNAAGCDSVVTLALTINVNEGVEETVAACQTYTWAVNGMTYTNDGEAPVVNDYTVSYTDANGCTGDSVLHLTLNPVNETTTNLVINEGGSYTYEGVMYTAPFDSTIDHTFTNMYGCDSLDHLHLVIPIVNDNNIHEINVEACGSYTWTIAGVEHTYVWIPMSERQSHGMALYKDVTANKYVYNYPMDTTFDANGVMTAVDVLYLNLLEATYSTETVDVPVSLGSYTIYGVAGDVEGDALETVTFDATNIGTPIIDTVGVGSVAYCDDYRVFTINVINNYDTTEVYACADATTYEWNSVVYTIGTPGHTFYFSQKENEGTLDELVHVLKVNQRAVNAITVTETACDSYTWTNGDSLTYTTSGTYLYNYTDSNECAATMTLNLTVNYNSNTAYTETACDTYTWTNNGNTFTYTASGDYTNSYVNAAGCPSVDTLHLTIDSNSNQTFTEAACNTYTWEIADGGNGTTYDSTGTYTYNYNAVNGCPSVNTLVLTINLPTSTGDSVVACDSTEWNGVKYTTAGTYYYEYNTTAGCASVDTLYLTVNNATHNSETLTQCDSYEWNGQTYTESGVYTFEYTNDANCPSVDTLHLTINVNTSTIDTTVTACDEYTWTLSGRLYNTSGDYTFRTTDDNGCGTTNTLHLTINSTSNYDSILYISDGSYRYTYQDSTQQLFGEGIYNLVEMYTNAAGCDSTLNIRLNVGTALLGIDNVVNCNSYTWRNGETYVFIDAAERAANVNSEGDAPIYKTVNGTYVYYNPTYTVPQETGFDSIYMLSLTLTQSYQGYDEVYVNVSEGSYTYKTETFDFSADSALMHEFVNEDREFDISFPAVQYCDSVITLTIHLVNNYQEVSADAADICVTQTSYTWRNKTVNTTTTDFDHAHTYYIYDDIDTAGIIEYIVVNQHPVVYSTERRTACDEYTWNGRIFTESTSNATFDTVDRFGCDSTVTLILVINHNTSTEYELAACETYIWTAANGGNGDTLTESGVYTYEYETTDGCPSVNTLTLTINHNTSTKYVVDACDSYIWENGDGNEYTVEGSYTYAYTTTEGCPSVDTLVLTLRSNSNQTFTETACDSYTWTAEDGGDGETYTTSGVYTYDYEAENGCPSTNTLNLTINVNSSTEYTLTACDSYTWHGTEYTASGDYTYDYADANNCASEDVLHLTINASTHNSESVVACQSYTWHGTTYTNPSSVGDMFYGTYEFAYVNEAGCYSVDTLHLTLGGGRTFSTQTVANCGPYTWIVNDEEVATLSESVETSTSFLNPRTGCDSVVFLYLTIFEAPVTNLNVTICDNELPYTWTDGDNTTVLTEAGEASVTYPFSANCDSTVHLTLTVNPTKTTALTDQICMGNDYNANGFVIAATDLPAAGEYTFTQELSTYLGCDSIVTLTLTVGDIIENPIAATACDSYIWNAGDEETYTLTTSGTYYSEAYANAEGCTTVDVLTLTINTNAGTSYTEVLCDGYMWNGTQYTESGDYTYEYTDGNGCVSTDTLHLTINNSVINTIEKTVCDNFTWTDGDGETYTTSGVHAFNYTTTDGCNGTDYLVLTVLTSTTSTEAVTACDSYTWNGETYAESGDYTYSTTNAAGCDSIATLTLTINKSNTGVDVQTACDSYTWIDGNVYTASNNNATYRLTNVAGCDSIVTLNLTLNNSVASTFSDEACNSYVWEGSYYTASGEYTKTFEAANGCDSIVTLTLTINQPVTTTIYETACRTFTWNGIVYNATGEYTQTFVAANGCDSIVTLSLTILNIPTTTTVAEAACDSYIWNGEIYTTSGTYTQTLEAANGCDSVVTLNLTINVNEGTTETIAACNSYTWNGQTYTTSGTYTAPVVDNNGCTGTATLNLTINVNQGSTETVVACDSYTWNGQTYTTSGTYTSSVTDEGCDGTATLYLTILQPANTTENMVACDSYIWNGQTYTTSGTYTNSFTDVNGCTATATLNLTINAGTTGAETATACGSYTWNGQTYTTSGSYTYQTTNVNGCDSTVTLTLTVNQPIDVDEIQSACESYTWNGQTYTTSGIYTAAITDANGCDATATLYLTILQPANTTESMVACDSYIWNGQTYTTSGTYTNSFTDVNGCDATATLYLTILQPASTTDTIVACDSYTWNGQTYTTSGTYTNSFTDVNGCAATATLNLTINASTNAVESVTTCGSYTWNGQTYTTGGHYIYQTVNAAGCDSTVMLNLVISSGVNITETVSTCDSYEWNGMEYTVSGTYTWSGTSVFGCDSTMTLNLTINYSTDTTIYMQGEGSIEWNGETFTESGVYVRTLSTVNGCDSVVTLNLAILPEGIPAPYLYNLMDVLLTINHNDDGIEDVHYIWYRWYRDGELVLEGPDKDSYSEDGNKLNGCYYLEVATDESMQYWVRSNEVCITNVGIDEVAEFNFTIAPNPVLRGSIVTISSEGSAEYLENAEIRIFDVQGRLVLQQKNNGTIVADMPTGMYMVRLTLSDGRKAVRRLIVK